MTQHTYTSISVSGGKDKSHGTVSVLCVDSGDSHSLRCATRYWLFEHQVPYLTCIQQTETTDGARWRPTSACCIRSQLCQSKWHVRVYWTDRYWSIRVRMICHECLKPWLKDHLPLKTTFARTVGWLLKPGFTVRFFLDCAEKPFFSLFSNICGILQTFLFQFFFFIVRHHPRSKTIEDCRMSAHFVFLFPSFAEELYIFQYLWYSTTLFFFPVLASPLQ